MNWVSSARDQLPLLFVLSPLIGFIVTWATLRFDPKLMRLLALSNMFCTLVILGGVFWQFESDLSSEADVVSLAEHEMSQSLNKTDSLADVDRTLDRMRMERLRRHWFVVDGTCLFPALMIHIFCLIAVWRMETSTEGAPWLIPVMMLFECSSLGVLTSYDLRVFFFLSAVNVVSMSLLISQRGSSSRRTQSEQFLLTQFAGGALIALGFSMLVVGVPWMKLPDSPTNPTISWHLSSLIADIQKWTARSELAFHYKNEVFPWMLLLLLIGFAIQSGVFPFHSLTFRIVSDSDPMTAILYLVGSLMVSRIAWFKLVMPLAPDLLASFDRWMLISAFGSSVWGALCAVRHVQPRQRVASIFLSLSGIALLGCYTCSRIGMNGAWLMQQQLTLFACLSLLAVDSSSRVVSEYRQTDLRSSGIPWSSRNVLLMICLPILGLFTSGFLIVSALQFESLLLVALIFLISLVLGITILSMLNPIFSAERKKGLKPAQNNSLSSPLLLVAVLAVVASLFPGLLLHQSNSEFVRVFRRFEQSSTANSAEIPSIKPKDGP
jgi:NADH:ubiquinone oxidoreductase subunit 4 (subunit M)